MSDRNEIVNEQDERANNGLSHLLSKLTLLFSSDRRAAGASSRAERSGSNLDDDWNAVLESVTPDIIADFERGNYEVNRHYNETQAALSGDAYDTAADSSSDD